MISVRLDETALLEELRQVAELYAVPDAATRDYPSEARTARRIAKAIREHAKEK